MQTIDVFWYKNILEVQVIDPAIFSVRNRTVYSRTIKIYQGIDNPIHVVVKNQDQKQANITGYTLQVDIQDTLDEVIVESFNVNWVYISRGLGMFTIPQSVVDVLDRRFYNLTTRLINNTTQDENPMYVDDNWGASLPLQVLPAYYPVTA